MNKRASLNNLADGISKNAGAWNKYIIPNVILGGLGSAGLTAALNIGHPKMLEAALIAGGAGAVAGGAGGGVSYGIDSYLKARRKARKQSTKKQQDEKSSDGEDLR